MSIERDARTECVTVVVGDEDVLIGGSAWPNLNLCRLWFAPLPEDTDLILNVPSKNVGGKATEPPEDAAAVLVFVNPEALDGFIKMLTDLRSKCFPPKET